ncbi:hypothetical protein [Devosia elaeis]|uniref:Uncharacterized protein n=1 Tax=Devosia elaeis TaxID=1770058 RepID=A0A178I560_9HYPH|nr:hypothetical protein [Devosia elaeis]OAM79645.1 hypothetical protein A3840_02790 [Devosia elaeis]
MSTAAMFAFLAASVFALWSLAVAIFSKAKRRRAFRNFGFAMIAVVVAPIVGVIFQGQEDAALGWRSSTDKRLAAEAGVTSAAIWYQEQDAVERERAAAAAQAAEVQAAAQAAAAEEKARVEEEQRLAAAAEAERVAAAEAAAKEAEQAECREELSCWAEEHLLAASFACDSEVERLARYDFEWTDGFLGMKFTHYRWRNQDSGIVTYIGDQIQFQNGFGAMQRHIYECDYDTVAERPVEVRAEPGRL